MKWVLRNSQTTPLLCGTLSLLHFLWSEVAVEIAAEACATALFPLCHDFYGERTNGKNK